MATYGFKNADEWAAKMKRRLRYVRAAVPARIIEAQQWPVHLGGHMPVVSGELRDSLVIDVGGMLLIGAESYLELFALGAEAKKVRWGWTVAYADRVNYGFTGVDSLGRYYNQSGRHFIEYGQMMYKQILREEVRYASTIE